MSQQFPEVCGHHLHDFFGCFWLEQLPGGSCIRWKRRLVTAHTPNGLTEATPLVQLYDNAACRRVISAKAECPLSVRPYGALKSSLIFCTKFLRLRYCMSAFVVSRGIFKTSVTSLIRSAPASRIAESTLRTLSDSTGRRGACA